MKATSAIQASIDVEGKEEGGYSGTFRWKSSKKLPRLSTSTSSEAKNKSIVTSAQEGWMGYFKEVCRRHLACTHIHIHTYIHAYIYTYIHTYIHTYIRTYMHISSSLFTYVFKFVPLFKMFKITSSLTCSSLSAFS